MKLSCCAELVLVLLGFCLLSVVAFADEEKPEPRELPRLMDSGPREDYVAGIVKSADGNAIVFENGDSFAVTKETEYFRETGRDLASATADIITPGAAVYAVGMKEKNGSLVAVRVCAFLDNALRKIAPNPDSLAEWSTNAVVEGTEADRILLDGNRYIPIDKHTKVYLNDGGKIAKADLSAIKPRLKIDFSMKGKRAVLAGQESGDVTVSQVIVQIPTASR